MYLHNNRNYSHNTFWCNETTKNLLTHSVHFQIFIEDALVSKCRGSRQKWVYSSIKETRTWKNNESSRMWREIIINPRIFKTKLKYDLLFFIIFSCVELFKINNVKASLMCLVLIK